MKTISVFTCMAPVVVRGEALRPEKAGPPPLAPKKLNFYCTPGLEGGLTAPEFETAAAKENIDNQRFARKEWLGYSIKNNNTYNLKDFKFYPKISKSGGVFSKNFQLFPCFFQLFPMDFQWISNRFPIHCCV